MRAHLPDGIGQGIQAPGVLGQYVQQHGCPLGLRGPAADFLGVIPCQNSARAQVVEVAFGSDLVAEVVPQSGQHLDVHGSHVGEAKGEQSELLGGDNLYTRVSSWHRGVWLLVVLLSVFTIKVHSTCSLYVQHSAY